MMTDYGALNTTLKQLHEQLESIDSLGEQDRAQLAQTFQEIQSMLTDPEKDNRGDSLLKKLTDAAEQFETSHPSFSGNLGGLIDALGRMGI